MRALRAIVRAHRFRVALVGVALVGAGVTIVVLLRSALGVIPCFAGGFLFIVAAYEGDLPGDGPDAGVHGGPW